MNLPMTRLRNARQRGTATPIQWTSAQARTPANRMTALLIRRFRVRAPDAPHSPSWDNLGPARPALGRVVETIDPQLRRTQCTQRTAREHGQSPIALGGGLSPAAVPRRDIGKQSHAEPDAGPAQPALLTPRRQVRDGDASHLTSPLSAHRRLVRYRQVVGDGLWAAVADRATMCPGSGRRFHTAVALRVTIADERIVRTTSSRTPPPWALRSSVGRLEPRSWQAVSMESG